MTRTLRPVRACAAVALAAVLTLSACSGGSDEPDASPSEAPAAPSGSAGSSGDASPSASEAAASPYLEVPDGVELTAPGSQLEYGDTAQVAWEPREGKIGVLAIDVLEVEEVTVDAFSAFRLDDAVRRSTPYFVRVRVENVGDTRLGNTGIPLYLLDGTDTLIQRSTFGSDFRACPSEPLPAAFAPGRRTSTCLVYLAPRGGEVEAISFRPTEEFVPITWTGDVTEPRRGNRGNQGNRNGGNGGNG